MKLLLALLILSLFSAGSFAAQVAAPVAVTASVPALAPTPQVTSASIIQKLKANGFNCKSQPDGSICIISHVSAPRFKYSQPVAIVVPANVVNPKTTQLYLHGFKGVCESADSSAEFMVNEFGFLQQIRRENSIMIYPMSSGKCETYNGLLVPQFSGFLTWLSQQIPMTKHWVIGGHSGAGRPIGYILAQNPIFTAKVDSVILLDAAYGMPSHIGEWKTASRINPKMDITSVYTGSGATAQGSRMLKSSIQPNLVIASPATVQRHCLVPTKDYGYLLDKGLSRH